MDCIIYILCYSWTHPCTEGSGWICWRFRFGTGSQNLNSRPSKIATRGSLKLGVLLFFLANFSASFQRRINKDMKRLTLHASALIDEVLSWPFSSARM